MTLENIQLNDLEAKVHQSLARDRSKLLRLLHKIRQRQIKQLPTAKEMVVLEKLLADSIHQVHQRRQLLPTPTYPQDLPISDRAAEIRQAIVDHPVIVVAGETGSGKTTQLPKICLDAGRGIQGMIGHTQPRRIAAKSVATRVASELQSELGELVGYQVRFHEQVSLRSLVKVMTDGILLAETQRDRRLMLYDTLIIDEAHERSLNIDFLLGYLKKLLLQRTDLKLIITSATIDTQRFSQHFDNAPIIEVSGRGYPISIWYRPPKNDMEKGEETDLQKAIVAAVRDVSQAQSGDILVFLAGERDIREAAEVLRKHHPQQTEILPLYSRLSFAEQNRIFQPHRYRRVILSTNVAETSLTVPGIRAVVDTGLARISRYSSRSRVQRLPMEAISKASANQRAGRCGRVGPGICVRLYSEEDFEQRPDFTEPEIQRTNLAAVILQMLVLNLGTIHQFPFIDAPDSKFINDGYRLLQELGALDQHKALTALGRQLAKFPLDPRLSKMVLAAQKQACIAEVLIIASGLAIQDPRERPLDSQEAADRKHQQFTVKDSDFLALLRLWDVYHGLRKSLSKSKMRKWCLANFLSYRRMQEWHDIHQQVQNYLKDLGIKLQDRLLPVFAMDEPAPRVPVNPAHYSAIHRSLLTGLLGNIGKKVEKKKAKEGKMQEFHGVYGKKFMLFPGSVLNKQPSKWVMCGEQLETKRIYGRMVAKILPEWIEPIALDLLKRNYSEPHWEKRNGFVAAYENVTLYGLTIIQARKVNFGAIDKRLAREIFIMHGLVEEDIQLYAPFFTHNQRLTKELEEQESKVRRRDILVDKQAIFDFYDKRIPEDVYSVISFNQWRKTIEKQQPDYLFLTHAILTKNNASEVDDRLFPGTINIQGADLKLSYVFEPGHSADGVTVFVPVSILNTLNPAYFDWLVPGMLKEKLIALIKSLPKPIRKNFVPAPDFAEACMQSMDQTQGTLLQSLTQQLKRMSGIDIPHEAWNLACVPAHLNMNYALVDAKEQVLEVSKDLHQLQIQYAEQAREIFQRDFAAAGDWQRKNLVKWDFGRIPDEIEVHQGALTIKVFPALQEEKNQVNLTLFEQLPDAQTSHLAGVRALFAKVRSKDVSYLRKNLINIDRLAMYYSTLGTRKSLEQDLLMLIIDECLVLENLDQVWMLRSDGEFQNRCESAVSSLMQSANLICEHMLSALAKYTAITQSIHATIAPAIMPSVLDIQQQLDGLIYPGFISGIGAARLTDFVRYLTAIERRWEKLQQDPGRDLNGLKRITPYWKNYLLIKDQVEQLTKYQSSPMLQYRWMLEEFRISVFAQEIKTAIPVSEKRLNKQWSQITLS